MSLRNRLGVNIHQSNDVERLSAAASLGCQYWRADFNWYDMNPAPDVWTWEYFDAMIAGAQTHGCSIAATIGGTPDWANGGQGRHVPPIEIQHWEHFVETVAQRYRGKVGIWLLWNEPNRDYWTGTLEEYVNYIVIPAYRVLKAVDSANLIGAPELSTEGPWPDWLRGFLIHAGGYCDIVTVHAYADSGDAVWTALTQRRRWWETFWKKPSIKQVIEQAGWSGPCWITETGWRSNQVGEEGQAQRWDQLLARFKSAAWPAGIVAYQLIDEEPPDKPPVTYGVFRANGAIKPAGLVLQRYTGRGVV